MDNQARALSYYNYGTAAPTIQAMVDAETKRLHKSIEEDVAAFEEQERRREKAKVANAKTAKAEKSASRISVIAVLGTLFVAVLMVFVVLAQINFNETAAESVQLNALLIELNERHSALELSFERAVDIKEVERFARDELGMSRPNEGQMILINSVPRDTAIVVHSEQERGIYGFGLFLKSLTEYFG